MADTNRFGADLRPVPEPANDSPTSPALGWDPNSTELVSHRYFGCASSLVDRRHSVGPLSIREDMRTNGGLRIAPLAIAALEAAGNTLDRYYRLWLTQIDAHVYEAALDVNSVRIENEILKDGRTQAFSEGTIQATEDARIVGQASASWAVLDALPPHFEYHKTAGAPTLVELASMPPIWETFGARREAQGHYVIPHLSSRIGEKVLHYGPILVLLEQACLDLATDEGGGAQLRPKMMSCKIMRAARKAPLQVSSHIYNRSGDMLTCRSVLTMEGTDLDPFAVMQWQARIF